MANQTGHPRKGLWNVWRLAGWGGAAGFLIVQLVSGAPWSGRDYILAVTLIGLVGVGVELAFRASRNTAYRLGAAVAILTGFLLTWINLAVGIIGDQNNPLNLIYFGIILIALLGSLVAGFRSKGTSLALFAAAAAQTGATIVAVSAGRDMPPGPAGMAAINLVFVMLLLTSAGLFLRAADEQAAAVRG